MKSKRELLQTRQNLPTQYHFISHINSVVPFDEKQTTSYRNNDIPIVGRDKDLEHLMDMLMQMNAKELTIISIVGPVGLGKTSLAQLIYNDTRAETFTFRIWVHVSMGNINLEKIGRDIVLQTTERVEESMQMQSIKNAVQDILNRYRCLIVLDSLCGKDEEVNELKQMLLTGRNTESKIIVTTHSSKVAQLISTVPPYKLSVLSEDNCSSIFSQRAMTGHSDPLFREYGEEIVRRCEGIPLVANFLGSVVNAQRQRREIWNAAKDKDMWKIEEDYPENKILPLFPSFKIIYYSMPHELRLCFVYCSIFPKGSVIDKKKLVQQWIALDMIESKHGTLPLDVTAEKYIDELKDIYFLQVLERPQTNAEISNNSDEMLCMNNLAHDLARSVAGEDILVILDAENERCSKNYDYRYAQVSTSSLQSIDSKAWPSKARSLIFKTSSAELQHVSEVLSVNKFLRVLDLSGCSIKEVPAPVFQLKQLRYLDASTLSITDLPPQICGFHKLQTLDLSETEVTELPAFIGNLKMLNYLNLQGCQKLQELNNLDLLHELHYLNLSCCPEVRRLPASLENLRKLRFLNLSECSQLPTLPDELLQSFSSFSSIVDLDLSGFEFPPQSLSNQKRLQIEVFGCQDCIVQSCCLSSGSCRSQRCSQVEEVGTSSAISYTTPKEPSNRNRTEGISASDVDYPQNDLKQKMASASHMDEQKSEEPKLINKPNSNGEIVQVIPGHQSSSSPSLIASSSNAAFASGLSSDASVADHPLSNDETAGLQPGKKCKEPQVSEHQASTSHMPAHPHEGTAAKRSIDNHMTDYHGEYHHISMQCNGSNQEVM
ncbi:unnamed protein product [Urochloa humidicola]